MMKYNEKMLAYCGIYCEQCSGKIARDEQSTKHLEHIPFPWAQIDLSERSCEGCKGEYCVCNVKCNIKPCALSKGIDSCADCDSFPCEHIEAFSNDGIPHHKSAIENLHTICEHGVDFWYKNLKPALKCHCGERQSWYYTCPTHSQDNGKQV